MAEFKKRVKTHHQASQFEKYFEKMSTMEKVLSNESLDDESAIYIHVPFCKKICSFCNLRRFKKNSAESYYKFLLKNLDLIGKTNLGKSTKIGSVYFGGGTPTVMESYEQRKVLDKIYELFDVKKDAEISTETSLTDLSPEKLKDLINSGLNRISVGIQTFDDKGRKLLGRLGDGNFAIKRLEEYLDTGLKNVNIDLIYNYPYQTKDILKRDMEIIGQIDLAGFSLYSLIINEGSKLEDIVEDEVLNSEEKIKKDFSYYKIVVDKALKKGYEFLEITKMAKPKRDDYKYIRISNAQKNIIPIGAGAGGRINNSPIMNPLSLKDYAKSLDKFMDIKLPVLNNLYKEDKIALNKIQFGYFNLKDIKEVKREKVGKYLESLREKDLVTKDKNIYTITKDGRFWANNISGQLMELL